MENNLTKLANKHYTDKGTIRDEAHGFTEFYEPYWKTFKEKQSINVLEIGVQSGGSLLMLDEYFEGRCQVYGIDINLSQNKANKPNIHTYTCDQGNKTSLESFLKEIGDIKFDIIIDDGSHQFAHQMRSLHTLRNSLTKDGIYCLEDLHTSKTWGDKNDSPLHFLTFFDNQSSLTKQEVQEIKDKIKEVIVFNRKNPKSKFGGYSITSIIKFE